MAFSFFYLLESCLLIANSIAILSDRFLKRFGLNEPFNVNSSVISPKNQLALILYFFRVYLKWPLMALNAFFIVVEILFG